MIWLTGPVIWISADPEALLGASGRLLARIVLPVTVSPAPGVIVTATGFPFRSKALTVTRSR